MLIKGFEKHFIKVANIKFLLPYNRSIFLIVLWILNTYCMYSKKIYMYHILLVLIIPTQCCYASLVGIYNTNVWACWNQLITCKSSILNIYSQLMNQFWLFLNHIDLIYFYWVHNSTKNNNYIYFCPFELWQSMRADQIM